MRIASERIRRSSPPRPAPRSTRTDLGTPLRTTVDIRAIHAVSYLFTEQDCLVGVEVGLPDKRARCHGVLSSSPVIDFPQPVSCPNETSGLRFLPESHRSANVAARKKDDANGCRQTDKEQGPAVIRAEVVEELFVSRRVAPRIPRGTCRRARPRSSRRARRARPRKRIAWWIQERAEGGLSPRALERIEQLAPKHSRELALGACRA